MKATNWTAYGTPDVLQLKDVEKPFPKNHEVLIKVYASTVTPGDCRLRACRVPRGFWLPTRLAFGLFKPRKPISGMEFSGEVELVGKDVSQFKKGDRVYGTAGMSLGANAEYVCLSETKPLVKIPDHISYKDAVAIMFGGLTALHFLRDEAKVRSGQKVLVNGASGSVGTAAVQIAKYYGAEVTGICSEPNHELVMSIGADHIIDYTRESFVDNGETYDIILDTVGNLSFSVCAKSLSSQGELVLIVADLQTTLQSVFNKQLICGVADESKEALNFLLGLVDSGAFTSVIDSLYPLEKTAEAHRYVDKGHKCGSVVLVVTDE
ncbi:NAD(P)-dependent alcohol dehydrogenase [Leucothrix pacifica]|uniref:NAD(P)-dependent alcohol dehydrogenase n=1 Tax=Leucothrix pacifica TaxID=1247513 RepID=A0A317CGD8_9GAMM|nr:NAD(P)-dependent alcohol dehydrogenase [Leucothrix pacifica]PWQ97231.1 NAD(P)-dependent alcohol dehydrogenase [Leucothrix pacifica]